jgi:cation diffusion facilitator CzcD-associated flavoprotein CzcO
MPDRDSQLRKVDVLVIGAGASGIGAAVTLREMGLRSFVVLEKAADIGGTWRDNTYPGCACDVPSALYSYSFAPNLDWTRAFAGQPEIRGYIERVAAEYGVQEHVRCGVEVTSAGWDPARRRWLVETTDGRWSTQILVAGTGPWNEPLVPQLPGLDSFPGRVFHSARWDHGFDLDGKRVAVVGTGASAVQFVPAIAPQVAQLHVYQRTAQWVLPKPDFAVPRWLHGLLHCAPGMHRAMRAVQYGVMEALGIGFRRPWVLRIVQQLGRRHLRRSVPDTTLRAALTPDYTLGCKRLLMSDTFYPALTRPNVDLHATAVSELRGGTVVGTDGSEHEVDAIIFGTGFHILDMPVATLLRDGDGRSLDDHWQGSPSAHLGTMVHGFPNLFLLLGPNLGTGHSSAFAILEAQLAQLRDCLRHMHDHGWDSVEVRKEVQDAYNAEVQAALGRTVYNAGGCSSYYLDGNGRNSFSWPWSTSRLRRRVGTFEPSDYEVTTPRGQSVPTAGGTRTA